MTAKGPLSAASLNNEPFQFLLIDADVAGLCPDRLLSDSYACGSRAIDASVNLEDYGSEEGSTIVSAHWL